VEDLRPSRPAPEGQTELAAAQGEIMQLSSAIAAAQARIMDLLATHGDRLTGGDEPVNWLAWAAGMKPTTARRHVRLAERLIELPKIKASFAAGEISFEKTETIAKIAAPETEGDLLGWARNGLCSQLATISSGFRAAKISNEGAQAAQRDRSLTYHYTDQGMFRLRAQLPADQGAIVAAAIDAAQELLWKEERTFQDHDLDDAEQRAQGWYKGNGAPARAADALVSLAETFTTHGLTDSTADRFRVMVHVDQAALVGEPGGTSELEAGAGLSTETARRIACDCSIVALLERDGVPIKLGHRRTISPALRRALMARDHHCVFPGCSNKRRLHGHHVIHHVDDGLTEPDNISMLCRRHHRLVHEGRYTMTFDGRLATFFRPDGSEVERVPTYTALSEVEVAEWAGAGSIDHDNWSHWIDPCDYSDAVAWLCDNDPNFPKGPENENADLHPGDDDATATMQATVADTDLLSTDGIASEASEARAGPV
jgi:hypothetical protein